MACPAPTSWAAVASAPNSYARAVSALWPSPRGETSNSRRVGSTESCGEPGVASRTVPCSASRTSPAKSAATARGTAGGMARVAISSPLPSAAERSSSASRIGATAIDSVTGPGTAHRPSRSQATTTSTGCASSPSNFSDTSSAVTPNSLSRFQMASAGAVSPLAQARTAPGTSAAPSAASILAAKSRCSESRANFIWRPPLPWGAPAAARR